MQSTTNTPGVVCKHKYEIETLLIYFKANCNIASNDFVIKKSIIRQRKVHNLEDLEPVNIGVY